MELPDSRGLLPAPGLLRTVRDSMSDTMSDALPCPPFPCGGLSPPRSTTGTSATFEHTLSRSGDLRICSRVGMRDHLRGFPGSMMCLFVHATAYGELRRSFTSSHSRVASALVSALITDALVLASGRVKALTDRDGISELYQRSGSHSLPYGLHDALCTLRLSCSSEKKLPTPP
jgi:hypothetical protein